MQTISTADLEVTIKDLVDVAPKSYGTDAQVRDAATWLQFTAQAEDEIEEILGPSIKEAHQAHKALTGQRKSLLDLLVDAKNRVRVNVANWIAGGKDVDGFYIKRKWRVTVKNIDEVPDEYIITTVDMEKLEKWATESEGKVAIPGCEVEQQNILFPSPAKKDPKEKAERPAVVVRPQEPPPIRPVPKEFTMKARPGVNVVGVGWMDGVLRVAFAREDGHSFYRFADVPKEVYDKLSKSPYPDKLFGQIVKGKFPSEKEA